MARTSAAEGSVSDVEAEKKQNKQRKTHKSHSKTEITTTNDSEQSEPTIYSEQSEQSEVFTDIKQNEEDNNQIANILNSINNSLDEIQHKDYISFGRLYYEFSIDEFKGLQTTRKTRLMATISNISKSEYKNKNGEDLYTVKYSVMQLSERLYEKGVAVWKHINAFDIAKAYESKNPNKYDYRYCLSDKLNVTKDVADKILENNGIFTIYVKWYSNVDNNIYKFVYNNREENGVTLSVPSNDKRFKLLIDYYNNNRPDFVNKYTYKIYDNSMKINLEFRSEDRDAWLKSDAEFLKAIGE